MSVTLCEDTHQGREALRRSIPDLILLDYVLPEQNGAEFLASLPEEFKHIPVIIMTAKDLSIRQQFRGSLITSTP
jgi:DNA-binding response OmpR family regulator